MLFHVSKRAQKWNPVCVQEHSLRANVGRDITANPEETR